jgi:hypothetical protein
MPACFRVVRPPEQAATVTNADLNRVLNEPQYSPLPTLSVRLASVINCNTRHAGQIEYLRGLVNYGGWFPGAESEAADKSICQWDGF